VSLCSLMPSLLVYMSERIDNGHYRVDSDSFEDDSKNTSRVTEYRVVQGKVANDEEYGALSKQFGFSASKWYAYKWVRTSVVPKVNFSPTAPESAFEKTFVECQFAQEAFDTKKSAVEFIENEWL